MASPDCPLYSPFFGFAGTTAAMVLSAAGAAYGTAKSGITIATAGVYNPQIIMTALLPVVMSGVLAIYGMIISVFISSSMTPDKGYALYSYLTTCLDLFIYLHRSFLHMGAGFAVGFSSLASGISIGVIGSFGVQGYAKQRRLFLALVLLLIFAEVIALYGLLTAIVMDSATRSVQC